MKAMKNLLLFIFLSIITLTAHAQDSITVDTINFTNGKWTVCTDNKFSPDYKCTNGWTNYNFNKDGTYIETQKDYKGNGTYKFNGNALFIKPNYAGLSGNTFSIIWLDKNRFYNISKDSHEGIVYTYFERIK